MPKTEACSGQLIINDTEAEVVRHLFHWLVDEQLSTYLTFRTLFRTFEAILEEPPERGAGATYKLLPALQPIAATSVSP